MQTKSPPVSPIKSIRHYCLWCCLGSSLEVRECTVEKCALHPYRFGKNPKLAGSLRGFAPKDPEAAARKREEAAKFPAEMTPVKAIHLKCVDCYGVRGDCKQRTCDLYHIRRRPSRK